MWGSFEEPYQGSLDSGGSRNLSPGAGISAMPACSSTVRASDQNTARAYRGGSTNSPAEKGNRSVSVPRSVREPDFCDSQERQFSPPSVQLETVEPVHQEGVFQDGGNDHSEGIGAEARLVLHNRSERWQYT